MKSFVGLETTAAVIAIHFSTIALLGSRAARVKRHRIFPARVPALLPFNAEGYKNTLFYTY